MKTLPFILALLLAACGLCHAQNQSQLITFGDLRPNTYDSEVSLNQKILLTLQSTSLGGAAAQGGAPFAENGQMTAASNGANKIASRATRRRVAFVNTSASETVYFGFATGVTAMTGVPIAPGGTAAVQYSGEVYFFSATGLSVIAWFATYD